MGRGFGNLKHGVRRIGDGDLAHRIESDTKDEFGDLAAALHALRSLLLISHHVDVLFGNVTVTEL